MTSIDPPTLDTAAELAATAAGSVPGVHALGSLMGRASDAVRERVGLASTAPGVKIDNGRGDAVTATISLVVDYPHKLHEVSDNVRAAVKTALAQLGRGTIDVDVVVTGVFGPFDRDVVAEAEEKADAVAARASEVADDVKARGQDAAARASATVDAAVAKTKAGAASVGAATVGDDTTGAPADVSADDRGDVTDVVADALEDAAIDIAIAADEVRATDDTAAVDDVQSLVEDERPRS